MHKALVLNYNTSSKPKPSGQKKIIAVDMSKALSTIEEPQKTVVPCSPNLKMKPDSCLSSDHNDN